MWNRLPPTLPSERLHYVRCDTNHEHPPVGRREGTVQIDESILWSLMDQSPNALMALSIASDLSVLSVAYVNPAFTRLTEYAPADILKRDPNILEGVSTSPLLVDETRTLVREGVSMSRWQTSLYKKSGKEFTAHVSLSLLQNRKGQYTHGIVTLHDLDEARWEDELQRQSERFLQRIAQTLPAVLFIYDSHNDHLRYVSHEALTILGYLPEELTTLTMQELQSLVHDNDLDRVTQQMNHLQHHPAEAPVEFECRVRHRDGEWKWLLLRCSMFDEGVEEPPSEIIGVVLDITDSRRMREQLDQLSRLESLGRLAGGVAHDFNNLLTIIQNCAEMARATLSSEHPAWGHLSSILEASQRAGELTSQMVAFARKQIVAPEDFDLNETLKEMQPLLSSLLSENIRLETVLQPNLWQVHADRLQVEQVILNMVLNARDAMPNGGTLTIESQNASILGQKAAQHAQTEPGEYVELSISDTGIGMDEQTLSRIFEPFFTTKAHGAGLGLSTCYGIVRQAGGYIWVDSEPGKGSIFKIYLPRAKGEQPHSAVKTVASPTEGGQETILLVEDNDAVREVVATVLQEHGYHVLQAADGIQALAIAENLQGPLHLLLTDVVMPGMNGVELAQQVRQRLPEVKVLYTSGYTESTLGQHDISQEGTAFLAKPYRPSQLVSKVRELLDTT